ncbi:hypothetical protein EUTSA_v10016455mg [Eutrema salsugineum]|uniref:Calmodulin-binding domain-containing protein n=1 Tax=Eutrema salsugineum TaxID=72664 RepID=V4MBQ6_EUTSA|nr:calmodulin binding protein PICBP [Eutrema salsugineum]ESQ52557.1 hypothetical protein EUTSA_v10016455mg [Eutrema salsugineum]
MVQRKTCQAIESYNLQPETRFGQEHLKSLGPEMMMMKRTKTKRMLIDNTVSQSGKPQAPPKHDLVVKVTGGSPNYMKGTSSSEARKENKKRFNLSRNQKNQTGLKHDSRYGVNKERCSNKAGSRIVRGFTKAPSFKRCSQRATCSSTLKDSKFPEYLMLNHGETDDQVNGTSVLKVCPYTYCSLNGHLHAAQYPPLKSFISLRRRSLKSQKSVKREASMEDFVEIYGEEKKECENGKEGACEIDIETQISETVSVGAPRSETDSDEYSDSAEMVQRLSEGDHGTELEESVLEENLVRDDSVKKIQETCEVDDYSDSAEMVMFSEGDHEFELRESDLEETIVDDDSVKEIQETCEVDGNSDCAEMVRFVEGDHDIELKESDLEETLAGDSVKEIQEKANKDEEVIIMMKNSEADEETLKDKAEDYKDESQDQNDDVLMIEETAKVLLKQEESDATISWTVRCNKPVAETEDLRGFNPREPNYLPVVLDADNEKVDLKHQDMDERKNSEDWMFDYALQRAVTRLSSARKRKVALLVEAFETVQPIIREPAPVLSYGRHLQTCN